MNLDQRIELICKRLITLNQGLMKLAKMDGDTKKLKECKQVIRLSLLTIRNIGIANEEQKMHMLDLITGYAKSIDNPITM